MESLKIRYSKLIIFSNAVIFSVLYYFIISAVKDVGVTTYLAILFAVLTILFFYRVLKFWIPILKGSPAIELTPDYIIDYINGRKISWKDVDSMNYRTGATPGGNIVILNVKDSKKYYSENLIGGMRYWINKVYDGYPIAIRTFYTEIGTLNLFDKISEYFDSKARK